MGLKSRAFGAFVIVGFLAGIGGANAQDLATGLVQCREINDDDDRLDCFDNLARGLNAQSVVAAAPVPEAPPEPELTEEERFGMDDLPKAQKEKREKREKTKSITAQVLDIARNGRGKYVVILENGQIWRQLNADTTKLRVSSKGAEGATVEIKRKTFGGHSLRLDGDNRSIKVERIK